MENSPLPTNTQKSRKNLVLIIVLFLIFSAGLVTAYYFGKQNVKKETILLTSTPTSISTSTPYPTIKPDVTIPPSINGFFNAINQKIGEELKPSQVNIDYFFYKGNYSTQKVWQIDLTLVYNDKTKINKINEVIRQQYQMADSGGGGEAGNIFVETYANSNLECTIDSHNAIVKLSCLDK